VKGIRDIKEEVSKSTASTTWNTAWDDDRASAAALGAGAIAQYAEFFSFAPTTDADDYGLSRDDINSFFPSYSLYDLMKTILQGLGEQVKELIETASLRGSLPPISRWGCAENTAPI